MTWIVTSWRTDRLEAMLDARARESAASIVAAAERDARRISRAAARETADAVAYLEVLERLGRETLDVVRAQRGARATGPEEPPVAPPEPPPEAIRVKHARARRASMRESPLTELFRATAPAG
jgi:hypothetical protein